MLQNNSRKISAIKFVRCVTTRFSIIRRVYIVKLTQNSFVNNFKVSKTLNGFIKFKRDKARSFVYSLFWFL